MAIKLLQNIYRDELYFKKVVSEVQTLRKLTAMPDNIFTTQLLDLIMPTDPENNSSSLFIVMDFVDYDIKKLMN